MTTNGAEGLVYFDSTHLPGAELAQATARAEEQNATILSLFRLIDRPLSPSQVFELWGRRYSGLTPPLTSIRRAISTLTKSGALVKTEVKRRGIYGRLEYLWCLPGSQP